MWRKEGGGAQLTIGREMYQERLWGVRSEVFIEEADDAPRPDLVEEWREARIEMVSMAARQVLSASSPMGDLQNDRVWRTAEWLVLAVIRLSACRRIRAEADVHYLEGWDVCLSPVPFCPFHHRGLGSLSHSWP